MEYPNWLIDILRDPETNLPISGVAHDRLLSLVYPPAITGENLRMNRMYNRIAPFYHIAESVFGWLLAGVRMKRERKKIISLMNLKPGIRLLEVSPGSGVFQPLLREALGKDAQIASIDLSMPMLEQCCKQHSHLQIPLIQANAEHLPFADQSFDALFHIGGINRFNHPEAALADFVRVVRKGGLVAWGDEHMSNRFKHPVGRWLLPLLNPGIHKPIPPVPPGLQDVKYYEVYRGIAYFFIGVKA
jgi:ubiquinone/menaquinone biosynthesis C-methylase UbiE